MYCFFYHGVVEENETFLFLVFTKFCRLMQRGVVCML